MTCAYAKCKTGLPGVIVPIVQFRAQMAPGYMPPGHAVIGSALLCESCSLTANVHELIDDKRWQNICEQLIAAGAQPPDRDSLELLLGSPKDKPLPKAFTDALRRERGPKNLA